MSKSRIVAVSAAFVLAFGLAACSSSPADPASQPAPSSRPTSSPKQEEGAGTASQRQAMLAARGYLESQPFSKKGLVKQLKFDKYSTADAKWAVTHIKVDWDAQAVKAGEQYLSTQPFSKAGLVEQLKFDGFTEAQAEHGAKVALAKQ